MLHGSQTRHADAVAAPKRPGTGTGAECDLVEGLQRPETRKPYRRGAAAKRRSQARRRQRFPGKGIAGAQQRGALSQRQCRRFGLPPAHERRGTLLPRIYLQQLRTLGDDRLRIRFLGQVQKQRGCGVVRTPCQRSRQGDPAHQPDQRRRRTLHRPGGLDAEDRADGQNG